VRACNLRNRFKAKTLEIKWSYPVDSDVLNKWYTQGMIKSKWRRQQPVTPGNYCSGHRKNL